MLSVTTIKAEAKKTLKDKWSKAFAIALIIIAVFLMHYIVFNIFYLVLNKICKVFIINFLVSLVPVVVLLRLFGSVTLYGALRWFWFNYSEKDVPVYEVFYYFSDKEKYFRAVKFGFNIFIKVFLILLVCFAPSIIVKLVSLPYLYDLLNLNMPYFVSSFWVLGNALNVLGAVVFVFLSLKYFITPMLMVNDDRLPSDDAIRISKVISVFSNGKPTVFLCSFVGWLVVSLLLIPLLFTVPYFLAAYTVFCRHAIDEYNNLMTLQNSAYSKYQPPKFQ